MVPPKRYSPSPSPTLATTVNPTLATTLNPTVAITLSPSPRSVWSSGQDQMRIVKLRLGTLLPGIMIFLDTDDLRGHKIKEIDVLVGKSNIFLACISTGYFRSFATCKELRAAEGRDKQCIALIDPYGRSAHGRLSYQEAEGELFSSATALSMLDAHRVSQLLFAEPPIIFERDGAFQEGTILRLLSVTCRYWPLRLRRSLTVRSHR